MNVVLRLRNKRLLAHTFASALSMSVVICNRSPRLCQNGGIIYVWISICKIRAVSVCFAFCHYPKVLVSKYLNIHSRCENDRIIYVQISTSALVQGSIIYTLSMIKSHLLTLSGRFVCVGAWGGDVVLTVISLKKFHVCTHTNTIAINCLKFYIIHNKRIFKEEDQKMKYKTFRKTGKKTS